ncbi:MAG: nucleoside triphosphate pyrophosphohydrolase [Deltaproteobacteria bacterium HGW-Deltaproteobacteria-19]|jgi:tetrapyrrole methylase family protein/MazG family protein|nr:MAG: nucleoside triphosphate pyrophosphohydrolase [Deltaproteobacteria bacterium HGW-Deltaproteobacteria-19]
MNETDEGRGGTFPYPDRNGVEALLSLIRTLRSPDGCPWDQVQGKNDLGRYLLNEAYEILDALAEEKPEALREELGDLLFQILFLVVLAEEEGSFGLADVTAGVSAKMIRRHPHVFGDVTVRDADEVKTNWDEIKKGEKAGTGEPGGLLDGIPRSMPALRKAQETGRRAARVGFDWTEAGAVLAKIREETLELEQAIAGGTPARMSEEIGDLLFSVVNLARHASIDAEASLEGTVGKFRNRFRYIERELEHRGRPLASATLEEMDRLWEEAKRHSTPPGRSKEGTGGDSAA